MPIRRVLLVYLTFLVVACPCFSPPTRVGAALLPDLVPTSISLSPERPIIGKDVTVTFKVENVGSAASARCFGAFMVDDSIQTAAEIPPIDPGRSVSTSIDWIPSTVGKFRLEFIVDYWASITESNTGNNRISVEVEIWSGEAPSLRLVEGPAIYEVTQTSAVVSWATNVESIGAVMYGAVAGVYSGELAEDAYSRIHRVELADLTPSTTYHVYVRSQGVRGDYALSREVLFETLPASDEQDPRITFHKPGPCGGIATISVEAFDDREVERVELLINGTQIFTDYSPPYSFSFDTSKYLNGAHKITLRAFDTSGRSTTEYASIDVFNFNDAEPPIVSLATPKTGDVVTAKVRITAELSDDVGLTKAIFLVNGTVEAYAGLPDRPKTTSLTFDWETRYLPNGGYRLAVEAWDKSHKQGYAVCDVQVYNPPNTLPPRLKVSHAVTRQDNYFEVSVTAENEGDAEAENVMITDYLTAFQPLELRDASADYHAKYSEFKDQGICQIVSKVPIPGKHSVTYKFEAVPILLPSISSSNPYTPQIGETTLVEYGESNGSEYSEEYHLPATNTTLGEPIESAYLNALDSADYLIITNPSHLLNYNQQGDVDDLLATMAHLARLKTGALGYVAYPTHTCQAIQSLITFGGPWSSLLMKGWVQNGYLLIVGEEEIIPAWDRTIGTFWVTSDSNARTLTYRVDADYPYASTIGDETIPELSIGRIIGDTAAKLRDLIQTSINVYLKKPGYSFDRSKALLASGDPRGMDFLGAVSEASQFLSKKNPGITITTLDTPPLIQYTMYPNGTRRINEKSTIAVVNSTFFAATPEQDVIFLAGHGNPYSWDWLRCENVYHTVDPFGSTSPFIFASACGTGVYSGRWYVNEKGVTVYDPQVTGIAEAFLEKGAALYLGSLDSAGWAPYSNKFFEMWGPDESVASTVKDMKRSLGNNDRDRMWKGLYQVYGDAKYGAVGYPTTKVGLTGTTSTQGAPSTVDVLVPDYTVYRSEAGDRVDIPGGYTYLEPGTPQVPCYRVFIDYPEGIKIQDVALVYRSEPISIADLKIPAEDNVIPATGTQVSAYQSFEGGWWPTKDYGWTVITNPSGTTLAITVYPFNYNTKTREARFYKNYHFEVNYLVSEVEIAKVRTDKGVYEAGEPVNIEVEVNSVVNEGLDVIMSSVITHEGAEDPVGGLPLRTLKDLKGRALYSARWDSTGLNSGYYSIVTELRDTSGNLLDRDVEGFRISDPKGEIVSLAIKPEEFKIGEKVGLSVIFQNTGSVNLTGGTVTRIYDSSGIIVNEFDHSFNELTPRGTVEFQDVWDTSHLRVDSYRIAAFALYGGTSTPPTIKEVGVDEVPPTIRLVAWPQTLMGITPLCIEAIDRNGIRDVEFYVGEMDGGKQIDTRVQQISESLWQIALDTTAFEDGAYSITIKAADSFNNVASKKVEVMIRSQPMLDVTTQHPNAQLEIDGRAYETDQRGCLSVVLTRGNHTVKTQTLIEEEGSKALFTEWGDMVKSNLRTVSLGDDLSLLAEYQEQHLLRVSSPIGDPKGGGWYDEGTEALFSVTSPTGFIIQHVFVGWSGDSNSTSPSAGTVMDGPKTVVANWKTDYTQLYVLIGLTMAVITVLLIMKRR